MNATTHRSHWRLYAIVIGLVLLSVLAVVAEQRYPSPTRSNDSTQQISSDAHQIGDTLSDVTSGFQNATQPKR